MGKIIAIDGTSNAGKTTLCENLARNVENIGIVPGASLFAKIHQGKYPAIPAIPKNAEKEKENQKLFFKLELDRLIEANKMAKSGKNVFMDRSVLEILSVAYSFEIINRWEGIYENARRLYEEYICAVNKIGIELPHEYICLQACSEEIRIRNEKRKLERGQSLSESDWIEEGLIKRQIEFFSKLDIPENKDKFRFIDTDHMTIQDVLNKACELLNLKRKEREIDSD